VFGLRREEGTIDICVLFSEIVIVDEIIAPLASVSRNSTIELISVIVVPSRFSNAKLEVIVIPDANETSVDPSFGDKVISA
jgi:hypothetical protein